MSERRLTRRDGRVIAVFAAVALVAGLVGAVIGGLLVRHSGSTKATAAACRATSVADGVLPSVVTITATGPDGQAGNGTGELIRDGGYVLTNQHVVSPAGSAGTLTVRYSDGTQAAATLVGEDVPTDLAVIKVDDAGGRPLIGIGSSSNLRVGSPVVALGAPLGLVSTVTTGIVSAVGRYVPVPTGTGETHHLVDAIQTDASINPGNSGGPLVNCAGSMVGVNSAIITVPNAEGVSGGGSVGLGFAIPVGIANPIADQLIKTGSANHPELGLAAQPLPDEAPVSGLFVTHVIPAGPAELAGIQPGDVITQIAGSAAQSPDQLVVVTLGRSPGDTVTLTYRRDGASHTVDLVLAAP
ncbi:MAG TPA: trypsin-like peptidase domain-containing protein [Nocardioides sp.]|nr:trypsin-like peptidase domain-containing protein [Nocardioides sp.]